MSSIVERTGIFTSTQLYEPSHSDVLPPAPMLTEFAPILTEEGPVMGYGNAVLKDHLTLERRMVALEEITDKVAAYCKMLSTELPKKLKAKINKQTQEILQEKVLRQQEEMLVRISVLEQRFDSFVKKFNRLLTRISVKSRSSSPEHAQEVSGDIGDASGAIGGGPFETPTARRAHTSHGFSRAEVTPSMSRTRHEIATSATSAANAATRPSAPSEYSADLPELQSLGNDVNDIEAFTSTIDVDKDAAVLPQKPRTAGASLPSAMPPSGATATGGNRRPDSAVHNYKAVVGARSYSGSNTYGKCTTDGAGGATDGGPSMGTNNASASSTHTLANSYISRANNKVGTTLTTEQSLLMHIGNQSLASKPSITRTYPTIEAARAFEVIPGMSDEESSASSALVLPAGGQIDDIFVCIGTSVRSAHVRNTSPILTGKGTRSSTQPWLTNTSPTGTRAPSTESQSLTKAKFAPKQPDMSAGRFFDRGPQDRI